MFSSAGPSTIALGDSVYTVTVTAGGLGVEGAVVVLSGERGEYGAALTGASGSAVVSFRPRGPGEVDLVVNSEGYLPHESVLSVTGSGGRPYVSGSAVDDADDSPYTGNGDGEAGWGERLGLGAGVANGGTGTLTGVVGTLSPVTGCSLWVNMEFTGSAADPPVYLGAGRRSPSSIPFGLSVGEDVLGRSPRDLGEEDGCWLWLDSGGWHVRMDGTGVGGFAYRCSIEVYGDVTCCGECII